MKNVDVDIYINQLKTFFQKNPESLRELIGDTNENEFYSRVEEQSYKNLEIGDEVSLTQKQLIELVANLLNLKKKDEIVKNVQGIFQMTNYGLISMN